MSAKTRSRIVVQWLPVALFLGFVAVAVLDTNATAASKALVVANVAAGEVAAIAPPAESVLPAQATQPEPPSKSFVIASLAAQTPGSNTAEIPASASLPPASIAPLISGTPARAPARVFTINEVMAKHAGRSSQDKREGNIQLASIDPTATPDVSRHDKSNEPFGLLTLVAPDGLVWFKWRKVADEIRAQEPGLMRCLSDATQCSPSAARFAAIVTEAREHDGRVRLNFVNQRVNNAIRYTSDMTQWGTPDQWSAPLAAGKGSFETGLGDCEDYAIAKYVVLRAAGVSAKRLRVLLVHDNIARLDHAVLAANDDGRWYVLDNRWTVAVEDNDVRRFTPLFALDDQGVKLMAVPYAARVEPAIEPMSELLKAGKHEARSNTASMPLQKLPPGGETAEAIQPAQSGISALGLRPSIL
jgi:predicted transglutaminase-like cysteine proteinase